KRSSVYSVQWIRVNCPKILPTSCRTLVWSALAEGNQVSSPPNLLTGPIVNVIDDNAKHEVLVGVCGSAGAGKTSMINALLGIPNLLIEGHCDATTAAACKVSYNHDNDTKRRFRAVITFQNRASVSEDLEAMLEDIYALQSHQD